jgi:hypothetical protein
MATSRSHRAALASALLAAALAACGGGGGGGASATLPNLERYSPSKLASKEQCESAVTNYEKQIFLSTTTPVADKQLFHRTEAELDHRRRVDRCSISFSERQAACFAIAPSLQYIQNCELYAELQ